MYHSSVGWLLWWCHGGVTCYEVDYRCDIHTFSWRTDLGVVKVQCVLVQSNSLHMSSHHWTRMWARHQLYTLSRFPNVFPRLVVGGRGEVMLATIQTTGGGSSSTSLALSRLVKTKQTFCWQKYCMCSMKKACACANNFCLRLIICRWHLRFLYALFSFSCRHFLWIPRRIVDCGFETFLSSLLSHPMELKTTKFDYFQLGRLCCNLPKCPPLHDVCSCLPWCCSPSKVVSWFHDCSIGAKVLLGWLCVSICSWIHETICTFTLEAAHFSPDWCIMSFLLCIISTL